MDFVLYKNSSQFVPIGVKFQNMKQPQLSRGYHSFLEAYQPAKAFVLTKELFAEQQVHSTLVQFIPLEQIDLLLQRLEL